MNIYSCVDSKNIDKILVLFKSCYYNSSEKEKLKFYLLVDEMNTNVIIPSELELEIRPLNFDFLNNEKWLEINNEFSKYFYKQGAKCNHIMNFCRFFVFEHFPEINTAIYLDWDMIVQDDIFKLYEYYLMCNNNDKFIVAESIKWKSIAHNILNYDEIVGSYFNGKIINASVKSLKLIKPRINKLWEESINKFENIINDNLSFKTNLNKKTFNAGFNIVNKNIFNLESLRKTILILINIQKVHKCFRFGTQVIMNLLTDNIEFVESKWNYSDLSSSIIHWSGPSKPWDTNDEIWLKYKNI